VGTQKDMAGFCSVVESGYLWLSVENFAGGFQNAA
jgi:hypothetical protein